MLSVDLGHELLQGLRVFAYPVSPVGVGWRNLADDWPFLVEYGMEVDSDWGVTCGRHPTIQCGTAGTPNNRMSYWQTVWPDADRDFTVLVRFVLKTNPGSGSNAAAVSAVGNGAGGHNEGWAFGVVNEGATGVGMMLWGGDPSNVRWTSGDNLGATEILDAPMVAAATYTFSDKTVRFFRNGVRTGEATDTSRSWSPYISGGGTDNFHIGKVFDGGFPFTGDIAWAMVFSRVLSDDEIATLSQDDDWPFVDDDFVPFPSANVTYTTDVYADSTGLFSTAGPVTYTTGVDASFVLSGDLSYGPQPPTVATYSTGVQVGSAVFMSYPVFALYTTTVAVNVALSAGTPVTYQTAVAVSSRVTSLIDGRPALIGTERYRR